MRADGCSTVWRPVGANAPRGLKLGGNISERALAAIDWIAR
jgi:hypothetical protein